jgi:hypothetical protein
MYVTNRKLRIEVTAIATIYLKTGSRFGDIDTYHPSRAQSVCSATEFHAAQCCGTGC